MTVTPSMAELIRRAIDSRLVDVHTALPGRVQSYDDAAQTANVAPQVKRSVRDERGEKVLEDLPVIPRVPVAFPRAGSFFITFPLVAGDTGLLVFSERSIDAWRATGRASDPGDQRPLTLTGAVFLPGLSPAAAALAGLPTDAMVVGGPEVRLGGTAASDFVSLASLLNTELIKINTAVAAAIAAVVAGDGGAAAFAAMQSSLATPPPFPQSTAATKVKAE